MNQITEKRPKVKLIGTDGNIFAIMGKVSKALISCGKDKEYLSKVQACHSYNEALQITMKYADVY